MGRLLPLAIAAMASMPITQVRGAEDAGVMLIGSWRLLSYEVKVTDDDSPPKAIFGEHPIGRIVFTPEHTMAVFISAADRKSTSGPADGSALLSSMLAYTGRFRVDGGTFVVDVDGSWNEITRGTQQVRFFSVDGDRLTVRTAEAPSAVVPGKRAVVTLLWERER